MNNKYQILWVDDEIELLKPHIIFLEEKGYQVHTINNGSDAITMINDNNQFDIVFLDEQMPGMSGLDVLMQIKKKLPNLPVVMITKSEEEHIMEDAVGSNIADYLIKPVNPNQILLSLKKNLEHKKLISEKTTENYQQDFRNIDLALNNSMDYNDWVDLYKNIVYWELELDKSKESSMIDLLKNQKQDANKLFSRFVAKNYVDWVNPSSKNNPLLSQNIFKNKVFPKLREDGKSTFFILIDNLRFDQWKVIQPIIEEYFRVEEEAIYYSILPTSTQYARNSIFSGLLPSEIAKRFPKYWVSEEEEGMKNHYEEELLNEQLSRNGKKFKCSFNKILNLTASKKLLENINNLQNNILNVIIYNFVDMLSHARTDVEIIKELAEDEAAYRSLTLSWFEHSPLLEIIKIIAEKGNNIIITTDHGSIRVSNPVKVLGEKNISANLRYKTGRGMQFDRKEVFEIKEPESAYLPKSTINSTFIFADENNFFAYPNNFNHYVSYYRNTFQHGGISLEEMLIPFIHLTPKQ